MNFDKKEIEKKYQANESLNEKALEDNNNILENITNKSEISTAQDKKDTSAEQKDENDLQIAKINLNVAVPGCTDESLHIHPDKSLTSQLSSPTYSSLTLKTKNNNFNQLFKCVKNLFESERIRKESVIEIEKAIIDKTKSYDVQSKDVICGKCKKMYCKKNAVIEETIRAFQFKTSLNDKVFRYSLYVCDICYEILQEIEINYHIAKHVQKDEVLCPHCNVLPEDIELRIYDSDMVIPSLHKSITESINCKLCDKFLFKTKYFIQASMDEKLITVFERNGEILRELRYYICYICGKFLRNQKSMVKHLLHVEEKNELCAKCKETKIKSTSEALKNKDVNVISIKE
ncbi:uncharacterized protein LOC111638628 [Centruroides sculpturatus]|uniref:uncharacterized protein LOC111638628 n=1 Tax=Centruroides sculpturatus TaxID=218467 RepID=UPI000C6D3D3A|nr:uncharacterized protein LOC111638628 [Centruroides sculpturatus]